MWIAVLAFIAIFVVVFLIYVVASRFLARRASEKADEDAWAEGHRRRTEASQDEAWRANQRMKMK
jgi:NADH:ubiquinone oxidoreductase subunit 3 (subunit A)